MTTAAPLALCHSDPVLSEILELGDVPVNPRIRIDGILAHIRYSGLIERIVEGSETMCRSFPLRHNILVAPGARRGSDRGVPDKAVLVYFRLYLQRIPQFSPGDNSRGQVISRSGRCR